MNSSTMKLALLICSAALLAGCGSYTGNVPADNTDWATGGPKTTYDFTNGEIPDDFFYCYSIHNETFDTLSKGEGCIENSTFDADVDPGAFIGLQTKKSFRKGTIVTLEFEFEDMGAPLLLFCKDFFEFNSHITYSDRWESVAWVNGLNIWKVGVPSHEEPRITANKLAYGDFHLEPGTRYTMVVKTSDYGLEVKLAGHQIGVMHKDLPQEFSVGLMACEGPCRFYSMIIEEPPIQ